MNDVPWAMQLAVRYDKVHPASQVDVCEAAARAVVALLDDPRSRAGGEWSAALTRWRDGRIRKLVRRARGIRWDEVQNLPGVTVEQDDAAVRAFVPGPTRPLPPELHKLQVSGTNLPHDQPSRTHSALVTITVSPHADMTTGKVAAQCAHAAQRAYETMDAGTRERWREAGFAVRVEDATPEQWTALRAQVSITDAGFTELDGPTETTRAHWAEERSGPLRSLLQRVLRRLR